MSSQTDDRWFPPVEHASPEGLLAIGGDLSSERLLEAYKLGIFPWYSQGQPILWWSPDPRAVLYPRRFKISRSLRKNLRNRSYHVTADTVFDEVIKRCAAPRPKEQISGTWITSDMIEAYLELHQLGYAHSVETWADQTLVGGLYGISLGAAFFGESMFSARTDASKIALAHLVRLARRWDFHFIDCQVPSPHIMGLGAAPVPRQRFLQELELALKSADRVGKWQLPADVAITPP